MKKNNALVELDKTTLINGLLKTYIAKIVRHIEGEILDDSDVYKVIRKNKFYKSIDRIFQVIYGSIDREHIIQGALDMRRDMEEDHVYLYEKYNFYSTYFKFIANKFPIRYTMHETYVCDLFEFGDIVLMESYRDYIKFDNEVEAQMQLNDDGLAIGYLKLDKFKNEWLNHYCLNKGLVSELICGTLGLEGLAYSSDMKRIYFVFSIEEALELSYLRKYCIGNMERSLVSGIRLLLEKKKVLERMDKNDRNEQ